MAAHQNDWDTSAQRSESSSSITSSFDTEIAELKSEMVKINKNLMRVLQLNQQVKAVTANYETCGGPHSFSDCPAIVGNTHNVYVAGAYQGNSYQLQGNRNLLSYRSNNYLGPPGFNQNQNCNNQNQNFYNQNRNQGNFHPQGNNQGRNQFFQGANQVERETEATKDMVHPTNNGTIKDVQPPVVQTESPILNFEPVDLNFNISFADALILMAKFGPSIKSLLAKKDKLCELARTPLNKHCSVVLLKRLPEKLGDLGKFLISCDFPKMAECLALADLGAYINLMPFVAEDVYVKVGKFHFPADFVVIDFDADRRVPLILERSFLKTRRALIDVFEGEPTFHVGKEAITFNLDQTSRYSANYNEKTANRIDVINMAYEEYSQEVLGFSDVIASSNPTLYYDSIVSTTYSTLSPFRNSDFLLEEVDAFLALKDDPTSPEVDQSYVDTEWDILLLKAFF
nr:hypothetical protein [Tanacetum cinerariifolium]